MAKKPTTIKIQVKLPEQKKPEETKPSSEDTRLREWPWRIMRGPDTGGAELQIEFWDAMTVLNPQTEEYELHEMFQNTTAVLERTVTPPRGGTVVFKHNTLNTPDATALEKHFATNSIPVADKIQLDRMDDSAFDRDGVLPVGVYSPNMQATLLNTAGETIDATDYISYYEGTSIGTVLTSADKLTYDWLRPKMISGHLRIAEKTSAAVVDHIFGAKRYVDGSWDGSLIKHGSRDKIEGIFWNGFDTSDTTNFKITTVPKYDCDEADVFTDPVLRIPSSATTKARVFLTRRRCHFVARYDDNGTERDYGVFCHWPSDLMMPTYRKQCRWELTANYPQASWEEDYPEIPFNEDNTHAVWEWDGDSEDLNGLYILNASATKLNVGWILGYPGWKTYREADDDFTAFYQSIVGARTGLDDVNCPGAAIGHGWTNDPGLGEDIFTQTIFRWTGSMPDGKCPYEATQDTVKATLDGVEVVSRTSYKYSVDDFPSEDRAKMTALRDGFLSHPFLQAENDGTGPSGTLKSWGVSISGPKQGDLVAVLDNGTGKTLWIWRKTDETLANTNDATNEGSFTLNVSGGTAAWQGDPLISREFVKLDKAGLATADCACSNAWGPFNYADLYAREGRVNLDWGNVENKAIEANSVPSFRRYRTWGCWWTGEHEGSSSRGWPGHTDNGDSLDVWQWGDMCNECSVTYPDCKSEYQSSWPEWWVGDTTPRYRTNEECTKENYEICTVQLENGLVDLGADYWMVLWFPESMN